MDAAPMELAWSKRGEEVRANAARHIEKSGRVRKDDSMGMSLRVRGRKLGGAGGGAVRFDEVGVPG